MPEAVLQKRRMTSPSRCRFLSVLVTLSLFTAFAHADALTAKMQEEVDRGTIAGAVTLVATKDGVKQLAAVGKADLTSGRKMKTDDLFWIASMTKPMTAVAVAMLVEEGKLTFTDPVEKYLPEFSGQWLVESKSNDRMTLVRPARPITIHDLLTHTSGLDDMKQPRPHSSLAELCVGYAREALLFPPGSKWQYCNSGINTLGRIVEVASGQPYAEFMQQRLFNPLGMKDTTFWPSPAQAARLAKSYKTNKATGKLEETPVYFLDGAEVTDRERTPKPAGGLFSTARDVAQVYRMMLNGGSLDGQKILSPEMTKTLITTQSGDIKTGFTEGMSWGYGFQVLKTPQSVTTGLSAGSFGHGGAYTTQSWGDPVRGRVYILMVQITGQSPGGDASALRGAFQQAAAEVK